MCEPKVILSVVILFLVILSVVFVVFVVFVRVELKQTLDSVSHKTFTGLMVLVKQ